MPLPPPPDVLRRGPFRAGAFSSRLHDPVVTALVGRWLGIAFLTCFVTGLISHVLQQPPSWLVLPSRPVWGYRLSQGIHVTTGLAAIPLLLAKLWTVYPRLFAWPPATSLLCALERLSLLVLVPSALLEVATGVANVAQWYPWPFFFPTMHFWLGWITVGALLVHVATKAPVILDALRRPRAAEPAGDGMSRRGFMTAVGAAVGVVTLTTAGQTVWPLRHLTVLVPRRPAVGPQGLPVNRTAAEAGVEQQATADGFRLEVRGPRPYTLSLAELRAMPQHQSELPITCVEGWSASARWGGVRLADLLDAAGAPPDASARVVSLEQSGIYNDSEVGADHARDPLTLLALDLEGEPLALDHGFPCRLIAPNRPGVLQTKWVTRLEVLA